MQVIPCCGRSLLARSCRVQVYTHPGSQVRHKSSLGAINEGLRRTKHQSEFNSGRGPGVDALRRPERQGHVSRDRAPSRARLESYDDGRHAHTHRQTSNDRRDSRAAAATASSPTPGRSEADLDWVTVPYTTAQSEWIYGTNSVIAALRARRRTLHKLYVLNRSAREDQITRLVRGIPADVAPELRRVDNAFVSTMDKISLGRPHNGVVLETSPLPFPVVDTLGAPESSSAGGYIVPLNDRPNAPRPSTIDTQLTIPSRHDTEQWKRPFVLFLDGIVDPGNLGNILRTALFYGIDAVAVAVNTCAPIGSSVVVKASSGAIEALNLYAIERPAAFIRSSRSCGWNILAATAPTQAPASDRRDQSMRSDADAYPEGERQGTVTSSSSSSSRPRPKLYTSKVHRSPLADRPCVLMLGAEGEGLRQNLLRQANADVVIGGSARGRITTTTTTTDWSRDTGRRSSSAPDALDVGVDSLNVGAATAALLEALTRPPRPRVDERQGWANRGGR